jgi:hypothetical protein
MSALVMFVLPTMAILRSNMHADAKNSLHQEYATIEIQIAFRMSEFSD